MNNQSEDRILGYVGTYPVGDYNAQTEYEYLNVVTHRGSSYVCIKEEGCTAVEPPNEECWQLFAGKGDTGEKGDTGDVGPVGPKPVNGVDYNTEAEQKEFKDKVVADSKADLEKYITEKETQLDNYTKDKETKLDDYVTDTVKPKIDTYVEETTKKDIDEYEKKKETALDTYTDTKKTDLDNYVENTSKTALDQYEKDKETELETAKNTAIVEYDAHAESVLTETNDLFNALDTEKISGTELYIEDAKSCRVINTGVSGMYKQETTKGINLINVNEQLNNTINRITKQNNKDGSLTLTGTATAETKIQLRTGTLKEGKYTYKCFGNPTDCVTNIYYVGNIVGEDTRIFTVSANSTNNYVFMYIIPEGTTINVTIKPMLVNGEYTADTFPDFEPFTGGNPSPNSDYLQEIEQVESVNFVNTRKNILPSDFIGKIITSNASLKNIKVKPGKDYYMTLSQTLIKAGTGNNPMSAQHFRKFIDKDGKVISSANFGIMTFTAVGQTLEKIVKFTIPQNCVTIELDIGTYYSNSAEIKTNYYQLEERNATEYEPYKKQTIDIDLKGNKLCAVSDKIKDKLLIDRNGNVALQKNVNKISTNESTFTLKKATEAAEGYSAFYSTGFYNIIKMNGGLLCNYFQYAPYDGNGFKIRTSEEMISDGGGYRRIYFRVKTERLETDDESGYKKFLTDNNIIIYHSLETSELIDLGQIPELPKTFEGINNIWAETNLGNTEIEIEYVQDVKKLLEKQAEQQNARLDNIEALLSTTETSALLLDNMQTDLEKEVE